MALLRPHQLTTAAHVDCAQRTKLIGNRFHACDEPIDNAAFTEATKGAKLEVVDVVHDPANLLPGLVYAHHADYTTVWMVLFR